MVAITETIVNVVKGEARKKVQTPCTLDSSGSEVLDSQPLFLDAGFRPPETQAQKIARTTQEVYAAVAAKLAAQNMTEEEVKRILDEEDDFSIPEDFVNNMTAYEARMAITLLEDEFVITEVPPETPGTGERTPAAPEATPASPGAPEGAA